jgi:hypothetical protein
MPVPRAPHVTLADDAQSRLESIVRAHSTPQALSFRCQLILRLGFAVHRYMNVLLSFVSSTYEKQPKDTSRNACIYVDGIKAQK